MSVLSDGIGDRDIPGATAKQLVDVSVVDAYFVILLSHALLDFPGAFLWLMMETD